MPGASAIPHSRCVTLSAQFAAKNSQTVENDRETWHTFYKVRPRKDHRAVDLISDALPFGACGTAAQCNHKRNRLCKVFQPLT